MREYSEAGTGHFNQEYRLIAKNGDVRWVEDHTVVERSPNGQVTHFQGIVIDVTSASGRKERFKTSAGCNP